MDIDKIIAARHPIETRGINQYIEFMFFHGGLHALRSDPFNRIFKHINEADVRAIVGFEITAFERQTAETETVVLWDELFGDNRVVDAFLDLTAHKFGGEGIGPLVRQNIAVIADPNAEPWLRIEFLPECFPFFRRGVQCAARIGRVDETADGLPTTGIDLVVTGFNILLLFRRDLRIVQRCGPIGMALKDAEMSCCLRDLRDCLDRGCARPDDSHPFPLKRDRLVGPARCMEGLPFKIVPPRNIR